MKKHSEMHYESPEVEIVEIEVEKGFATSGDGEDGNYRTLDFSPRNNSPFNF